MFCVPCIQLLLFVLNSGVAAPPAGNRLPAAADAPGYDRAGVARKRKRIVADDSDEDF